MVAGFFLHNTLSFMSTAVKKKARFHTFDRLYAHVLEDRADHNYIDGYDFYKMYKLVQKYVIKG